MKRRKYLKLTSIISIFGLSGCLGYFKTSKDNKEYRKTISEGENITVKNSTINDGNLSINMKNNINKKSRATVRVVYYNSDGEEIGYPTVYSTDPIPANSAIDHNITIYEDTNKINSYALEVNLSS